MAEIVPLVDCCHTSAEDRVFRPGVSPFAIDPNPLLRTRSRRRLFRTAGAASMSAAAAFAAACGGGTARQSAAPSAPSGQAASAGTAAGRAGGVTATPSRGLAATAAPPLARLENIDLPYCSQILCGVPLETAVKRGFFAAEGLNVKLVYMKGGALAVQALIGGSVDWVGAAMDVLVSAHDQGATPVMIASLSSLPFFALVAAPGSKVQSIADFKGKKIGVANLNTSDHLLARFLLEKNGIPDAASQFAPLGPNLFEGMRVGQVEAGMVQEPALTQLTNLGARVIVNFMKQDDVTKWLGGAYQFVGLNTRPEVIDKKPETLRKLIRALTAANRWVRSNPGAEIVKNLPEELVAGSDLGIFAASLDQVKLDLYPESLVLDQSSVQRVIDVQKAGGAIKTAIAATDCFTNSLIGV